MKKMMVLFFVFFVTMPTAFNVATAQTAELPSALTAPQQQADAQLAAEIAAAEKVLADAQAAQQQAQSDVQNAQAALDEMIKGAEASGGGQAVSRLKISIEYARAETRLSKAKNTLLAENTVVADAIASLNKLYSLDGTPLISATPTTTKTNTPTTTKTTGTLTPPPVVKTPTTMPSTAGMNATDISKMLQLHSQWSDAVLRGDDAAANRLWNEMYQLSVDAQKPKTNPPTTTNTTTESKSSGAFNALASWAQTCKFCPMFKTIEEVKSKWGIELFHIIAPEIQAVFKNLIILHIVLGGLLIMIRSGEMASRFMKLMVSLVITVIVVIILGDKSGVPLPWLVIREIEISALKLGALIISHTTDNVYQVPTHQAGGMYQALTALIEQKIWVIFKLAAKIMSPEGSIFGVAEALSRAVTALIMVLPYLFVIGIFIAFLVEAMFKFVSISMLSPLLMPALVFGWSRAYVTASLRILFGAFLTIVFASMAMGLTVMIVDHQVSKINIIRAQSTGAVQEAQAAAAIICESDKGVTNVDMAGNKTIIYVKCAEAEKRISEIQDMAFTLLGDEYFLIVIIGFVSVLLHLQSKSLASNISGANDGAGPAAAVVGATKVALGTGMLYGSRAVFGANSPVGQAVRTVGQHLPGLPGGKGATGPGGGFSDPNGLRGSGAPQSPITPMGGGAGLGDLGKGISDVLKDGVSGTSNKGGPRE